MKSAPLRTGKLPVDTLHRCVLSYPGTRRNDVLVRAAFGEDSSVLDFGPWACVVTTDPITGAARNAGWLGVHVACNDLAANGAEPVGVLVTLLFPESTTEDEVAAIMAEVDRAAGGLEIEVLGGHTEITPGLSTTIISITAIGKCPAGRFLTSSGARPGDSLILTKAAGLEGTAILATDFRDLLQEHFPGDLLARAEAFWERISVVGEGVVAASSGASALHDVTEGGVLGALYELAAASSVGFRVFDDRIPVLPETRALCEFFGADPLRLISSGAMLIAAPDHEAILEKLRARSIPASVIGAVTEDGRLLHVQSGWVQVGPCERDELWHIIERWGRQ